MSRLLLVATLVILQVPSAAGDDGSWVAADEDSFATGVEQSTPGTNSNAPAVDSDLVGTYHQEPACDGVCSGIRTCPDGTIQIHSWTELPDGSVVNDALWCPSEAAPPVVTDGVVATAFQRIPLPPSTFQIQPPGGRTLVNFETNFFTRGDTKLDRTVRLLGRRVDLRISAHSYTWHFDDGEVITTSKPGAPYPRLQITHMYLQTGRYTPALDVTWVADYRVNGGSWRPVPGSVTIEGGPANLRAVEATPTLVGY